jgi:O-succinylbenzoic acid--CoA ligase
MPRLIALDLPAGPDFVAAVCDALETGDAVFPVDQRLPPAERRRQLDAVRPTHLHNGDGVTALESGVGAIDGDAVVIATSGTTGEPKAAILTRASLEATTSMTATALAIDDSDKWLLCLPPAHIGGFGVVARAVLGGVPIDSLGSFDAEAVDAAGRRGATLVSLVPSVLSRVDTTLFRIILLGGSAIPSERPPNAVATYGMTETAGGVVYDGRPLEGVEIRVDADGQILLRSPSLLRGYRSGPADIDKEGFLATGDLGTFRDGVLSVDGRKDHVIITGGQKVWPERIEAVLVSHPDVAAVRVVGRADPEWGQIVVAQIVSDVTPLLDELRGLVKEQLPAYMAPRAIEAVDSIPLTALGKVRRS